MMKKASPKNPAKLKMIAPQFVVPDVVKTAEYYRDVLGFKILSYWHNPPVYAIVARDNIEIHFGKGDTNVPSGNIMRRKYSLDAYVFLDGVDELFKELKRRQANVVEGPVNQSYGNREIVIEDCNGFRIAFGENIAKPVTSRRKNRKSTKPK